MAAQAWHDAHLVRRASVRRDVFDAVSLLTTLKSPTFVWRGHASSTWTLKPAAHRKPDIRTQADLTADQLDLLYRARLHRHDYLSGWQMPDLALLALLQHNGAATALLDVTTDPYVALYFACEESRNYDKVDGLLVAVDVSTRGNRPTTHFGLNHKESLDRVFDSLSDGLGLYTPPDISPRFMAQRGRFLLGGYRDRRYTTLPIDREDWDASKLANVLSSDRGVGQPPKPAIVAIEIRADLKPQLRDILEQSFGLTGVTLFPDFHGFAAANHLP